MPRQNVQAKRWANVLVTCGLLLVLYATLFPFDFQAREHLALNEVILSFDPSLTLPYALKDFPRNVVLFIPFGFGFACLAVSKGWGNRAVSLIATLSAGLTLSFAVELSQVFLPLRFSSLADILANGVGTFLGFAAFLFWGERFLNFITTSVDKTKQYFSLRKLAIVFVAYCSLVMLASAWANDATTLGNWDPTFPLILGNERTGDRPWQGNISQLFITNRALPDEEVAELFSQVVPDTAPESTIAAYYRLADDKNLSDLMGNLLPLSWQGQGQEVAQSDRGTFVSANRWLQTLAPVTLLAQDITATSEFSMGAIIASATADQTGPARIVSISADPYHRNLTLAQEGADLVLRLRTPLTGENGMNPEWIVPNVFVDTKPRHVIITYNGTDIRIYLDQVRQSYWFRMAPEMALLRFVQPVDAYQIRLVAGSMTIFKLLYDTLLFVPWGFLLTLVVLTSSRAFPLRLSWAFAGVALPSLLLEYILAHLVRGYEINGEYLLLNMAVISGVMVMFSLWVMPWMEFERKQLIP